MTRSAEISPCGTYRYALRRTWNPARPAVLFVMLNPSTADAEHDDRTIGRCVGFARAWGYGGLLVGNLFAYRATRPRDLRAVAEPVGPENDQWLEVLAREAGAVVAAWGNDGRLRARDAHVLQLLDAARCLCLKRTKAGAPWHPLYVQAGVAPSRLTA